MEQLSLDGRAYNEDLILSFPGRFCGVLDGATPIKSVTFQGYASHAQWLVHTFVRRMTWEEILQNGFPVAAQRCMDTIKADYPLGEIPLQERPSCTVAAAWLSEGRLRACALGDCSVYAEMNDGRIEVVYDNRVEAFAKKTLEQKQKAMQGGLTDVSSSVTGQKSLNNRYRNQEGGFWVIGYIGRFAEQFRTKEWNPLEVKQLLICSDGFARLFREFRLLTPTQIMSHEVSLKEAGEMLRQHEKQYGGQVDFPCVKPHDDATAVLLALT